MLTTKQRESARKIIKSHYRLKRQPTNNEIDDEIENLRRKMKLGACCDIAMSLMAKLSTGQHPIEIEKGETK